MQSLGGFTSIEDLSLAPGVGTNLIEANRQILTVSAPSVQSSQMNTRKANTRNRFVGSYDFQVKLGPNNSLFHTRSSDSTSAQPTPSTTPVISSSSDTTADEPQNDCANSSNEWGACRLRQRRSTSRTKSLPYKSSSTSRHTRSSDSIIQTPPPSTPTIPTSDTTSTPIAAASQDAAVNTSAASHESTSSESENVLRSSVSITQTCLIPSLFTQVEPPMTFRRFLTCIECDSQVSFTLN